jgi:hypothetical protein
MFFTAPLAWGFNGFAGSRPGTAAGYFLTRPNINGLLAKGSGDAERVVIEDGIDLNIAFFHGVSFWHGYGIGNLNDDTPNEDKQQDDNC